MCIYTTLLEILNGKRSKKIKQLLVLVSRKITEYEGKIG